MLAEGLTLTIAIALAVGRYLTVFCSTDFEQRHCWWSKSRWVVSSLLQCNSVHGPCVPASLPPLPPTRRHSAITRSFDVTLWRPHPNLLMPRSAHSRRSANATMSGKALALAPKMIDQVILSLIVPYFSTRPVIGCVCHQQFLINLPVFTTDHSKSYVCFVTIVKYSLLICVVMVLLM